MSRAWASAEPIARREVVPGWRELRTAVSLTGLLLRLRWRMIRSGKARAAVLVGALVYLGILFAAGNVNLLVRQFAEEGFTTTAGTYAVQYLMSLQGGGLGTIGALALGSALVASLVGPLTGSAAQALAAADDLTGLRPHRLHRYFDSVVTSAVSVIGMLQLISLTAVASLLTIDGGRVAGMLLTWAIWPALVLATVAEGWLIEWVHRRMGAKVRRLAGLGLVAVVGGAVALDPQRGQTLFGIGTGYATTLRHASDGDLGWVFGAVAVIAAVIAALFFGGVVLCRRALALPAVVAAPPRARRRLPMARSPRLALAQVIFAQMVRTAEVRRPVMTIVAIGIPGGWLLGYADGIVGTLVVAVPLAVALAWGSNAFGVLGPGMTWLAAQPKVMRWLIWLVAAAQLATVAVVTVLCWLPPALFGRVSWRDAAAVAAATVLASAVTARSATAKAVHRPMLARLGTRGDVAIPPLTAINYTLRFVLWGGAAGVMTISTGDLALQLALTAAGVSWSLGRFVLLARQWRRREHQAWVVATVSAA